MRYVAAAILAALVMRPTYGGVMEFTDKDEWLAAVGAFTTIDFTGFPDSTFITNQYADLGVLFLDGNDNIFVNAGSFPNDGVGLDGNLSIDLSFDAPRAYIAVDFPGGMRIELFSQGALIYTSSNFGLGGVGNFAGLISPELFDAARLTDWLGTQVAIDDLHYGIPAPGGLALLVLGTLCPKRRRRYRLPVLSQNPSVR